MTMKIDRYPYKLERTNATIEYTERAHECMQIPQCVRYCASLDAILQSVQEAAIFAKETNEAEAKIQFTNSFATRTCAVYFRTKGKLYVAFDDVPDPLQNIILCRSFEGLPSDKDEYRIWTLPMNDAHIRGILKRAEKDGRVAATQDDFEYGLSDAGRSFAEHPMAKAILTDFAKEYAEWLYTERVPKNNPYMQGRAEISTMGNKVYHCYPIPDKHVPVFAVAFGCNYQPDYNHISAFTDFNAYEIARGVRCK